MSHLSCRNQLGLGILRVLGSFPKVPDTALYIRKSVIGLNMGNEIFFEWRIQNDIPELCIGYDSLQTILHVACNLRLPATIHKFIGAKCVAYVRDFEIPIEPSTLPEIEPPTNETPWVQVPREVLLVALGVAGPTKILVEPKGIWVTTPTLTLRISGRTCVPECSIGISEATKGVLVGYLGILGTRFVSLQISDTYALGVRPVTEGYFEVGVQTLYCSHE